MGNKDISIKDNSCENEKHFQPDLRTDMEGLSPVVDLEPFFTS